jgi:hypothetical protein
MLAHILALAVGLGSFSLYMAAFFFPEVHRKYDFVWSGVGLFYALVLWVSAGRITGSVLLGQLAGVALLGWFGWQTLTLRRELTPASQQTQVNGSVQSSRELLQSRFAQLQTNLQRRLKTVSVPAPIQAAIDRTAGLIQGLFSKATQPKPKKRPIQRPSRPVPTAPAATEASLDEELDEAIDAVVEAEIAVTQEQALTSPGADGVEPISSSGVEKPEGEAVAPTESGSAVPKPDVVPRSLRDRSPNRISNLFNNLKGQVQTRLGQGNQSSDRPSTNLNNMPPISPPPAELDAIAGDEWDEGWDVEESQTEPGTVDETAIDSDEFPSVDQPIETVASAESTDPEASDESESEASETNETPEQLTEEVEATLAKLEAVPLEQDTSETADPADDDDDDPSALPEMTAEAEQEAIAALIAEEIATAEPELTPPADVINPEPQIEPQPDVAGSLSDQPFDPNQPVQEVEQGDGENRNAEG